METGYRSHVGAFVTVADEEPHRSVVLVLRPESRRPAVLLSAYVKAHAEFLRPPPQDMQATPSTGLFADFADPALAAGIAPVKTDTTSISRETSAPSSWEDLVADEASAADNL
jgi:hypothetical protein